MSGCQFRKSIEKDFITGLVTKGSGLSSDSVYLTQNDKKIKRTTYTYGETFYVNFNNLEGFTEENGSVFPGMQIVVTDNNKKTIMKVDDLYADKTTGVNLSPLLLRSKLVLGNPIYSNKKYQLAIKIWDKKGKGIFTAKMPFEVTPLKNIKIEKTNVVYDEIYLFNKNKTVTGNKIGFDEDIFIVIDGLSGFKEENSKIFATFKLNVTDNQGEEILNYENLFKEHAKLGINIDKFKDQFHAKFKFAKGKVDNPIHLKVIISDQKGNASLTISSDLNVE